MSEAPRAADGSTSVSAATESDPYAPYRPDEDLAVRRSRWPVVFGAVSLMVGVFGMCMQAAVAASTFASGAFSGLVGLEVPPPPPGLKLTIAVMSAALVLLGILLIVGAAMLLLRRPLGARLVMIWVVLRLVLVVAGLGTGIAFLKPQVDWSLEIVSSIREQLRAQGMAEERLPPLVDREESERQAVRSIAMTAVAFSLWPFAMAIVLTRRHVRDDVASWRASAGG